VAIFLDSSMVLAAADRADLNHRTAIAWFERANEPLLLGILALGDLDTLLQRELGADAALAVVSAITAGSIRLVAPTDGDLTRASELMTATAEHKPRLADALVVAAAERLAVRRIATFDRRSMAVFQPRHVRAFDLEP
jgi:uncharacterized protein